MEKCHITDEVFKQYLFGGLDEDAETVFQQHLIVCGKCFEKVRDLRRLTESFHPETIAREEMYEKRKMARIVPLVQNIKTWVAVAASIVLIFAAGWFAGHFYLYSDVQLADNFLHTKIESAPEFASEGSISETEKNEFVFLFPSEERYLFNINQAFTNENDFTFKWSPKASNALLLITTGDGEIWDEFKIKNTDQIKINLTKYSNYHSVSWFLIVSESDKAMAGTIVFRK